MSIFIVGDLTPFQINVNDKMVIEHDAVHSVLKGLLSCDEIEKINLEFDKKETKEALFAYQCDKLECDLQCKLYDDNFMAITEYALNNKINQFKLIK